MLHDQPTSSDALRASMEALLSLVESGEADPVRFERQVMGRLLAVGRGLMQAKLESLSPAEDFAEQGVTWRVAVHSQLPMMTLFGDVAVKRPLFRAVRNGVTRCLVSERSGLVAGYWTQGAAKVVASAVAEMPMARAESFFADIGLAPGSRSSMLRLAGALSDLWEKDREAHEQAVREATPIPPEATTAALSLDGVMVLMSDSDRVEKKAAAKARGYPDKGPAGFREASVGVVSFYDVEGNRLATRRYGRMPEADKATTKAWLARELAHLRKLRPDLVSVAIADGAANNWSFLSTLGADHEVVDFYHAVEHLQRHISIANGASTVDTQALLRRMRLNLLHTPGAAARVFEDMHRRRERAGTAALSTQKTSGKRQPTFFERHHGRMDYAILRSRNLPIGSGVTESTCKLTICDRLRRTGMRWSQRGGQAIITLRAHRVSDTFDQAWEVLMDANAAQLAA